MKYNIGDVVKLKDNILHPQSHKGRVGIILEVVEEINTCRVLICGDTNNISPLGVWVIGESIEEIYYKADPLPLKFFNPKRILDRER